MHVSPGLGTTFVPLRLLAQPEVDAAAAARRVSAELRGEESTDAALDRLVS